MSAEQSRLIASVISQRNALKAKLEALQKGCVEVIEMLELTQSPIAVERAVGRLSALVKEGGK